MRQERERTLTGRSPVLIHSVFCDSHTSPLLHLTSFVWLLLLIPLALFFLPPSSFSSTHLLAKTCLDTEQCVYKTHTHLTMPACLG